MCVCNAPEPALALPDAADRTSSYGTHQAPQPTWLPLNWPGAWHDISRCVLLQTGPWRLSAPNTWIPPVSSGPHRMLTMHRGDLFVVLPSPHGRLTLRRVALLSGSERRAGQHELGEAGAFTPTRFLMPTLVTGSKLPFSRRG